MLVPRKNSRRIENLWNDHDVIQARSMYFFFFTSAGFVIVTAPQAAIPPAKNPNTAEGFLVVAAVVVVTEVGGANDGTAAVNVAVPEDCIDELDIVLFS
jgi:hypothetical protein